MIQQEAQADTATQGFNDVEDFRYQRVGYVDQGRKSDHLLSVFLGLIPGDGRLPLRWHYRSLESFLNKHGHLGRLLWAASNNSHLLMINGHHVLRIWHDTANSCYVDLADNVAGGIDPKTRVGVESIPATNVKKSKPFTKRIKVWQQWQMRALAATVKNIYGLHIS